MATRVNGKQIEVTVYVKTLKLHVTFSDEDTVSLMVMLL